MPNQPPSPPPNVFAERAATLLNDVRFVDLISGDQHKRVTLTLWLLELEGLAGVRVTRLLWGWVVRARDGLDPRWSKQQGSWSAQNEDNVRFRHARLSLTTRPASAQRVLNSLGDGRELAHAAADAGLDAPPAFASLRLGESTKEVAERFVLGPVRFLAAGGSSVILEERHRPLASPSDHSSFSAPVCRLHKPTLWYKIDAPEPLAGGDDIARDSLTYLEDETGFSFRGVDARRIGDIEWLSAPATDLDENKYVEVTTERERDQNGEVLVRAVSVDVRPGPLAAGTSILVRCRLYANQDIVADECHSIQVGAAPIRVATSTPISRYLITIWKPVDNSGASVWYEEDNLLMRGIAIGMGLIGLRGTLSTDWSRAVSKTYAKAKQRIVQLNRISQAHQVRMAISSESALEAAEREITNFANGLFPAPSGARFFEKGWFANAGVEFVTWFQQQTKSIDVRSFVLVDPFFDDVGLTEFFSRAKNTAVEYIAITNTQVPSFDDTNPNGIKSSRRERLLRAFSKLEPIFDSLNITVLDVNKQSNGPPATTQVFHDRYLLIYGEEAELLRGFHLSNSIQGATKKAPLLITPIPPDVLPSVGRYVAALKEGDADNPNVMGTLVLERLVASADRRAQQRGLSAAERPPMIPLDFFVELLGSAHHAALSWRPPHDTIRARAFSLFEKYGRRHGFHVDDWLAAETELMLQHAGLLEEGGDFILSQDILTNLLHFIERLAVDESAFTRWWEPFCRWRWRLTDHDEAVSTALAQKTAALLPRWQRFVTSMPQHPHPKGTKGTPTTQTTLTAVSAILAPFDEGLRIGEQFDAYSPHYGADPRIRYTLDNIAATSAATLVEVAEHLVAMLPADTLEFANAPECAALGSVLAPLLGTAAERIRESDAPLLERMLRSSLGSLRAIAARSIINRDRDVNEILRWLAPLSPKERLYVLAERVSDLRVQANRNNAIETEDVTRQLDDICPAIVAVWPDALTPDELKHVAFQMGGPGVGAWATSTLNRVLEPLVTAGKLSWAAITGLWGDTLVANLEKLKATFKHTASNRSRADEENHASSHFFYYSNDRPLSEAFVVSLVRLAEEDRKEWTALLQKMAEEGGATLCRPFIRSRNYSAWAAARDLLDWLSSIAGLILAHGEHLPAIEKSAWRAARERDLILVKNVPAGHNSGFATFRDQVREALEDARR